MNLGIIENNPGLGAYRKGIPAWVDFTYDSFSCVPSLKALPTFSPTP